MQIDLKISPHDFSGTSDSRTKRLFNRLLRYQEHSKIFDEKLSSPLLSFLNGTIHFCLHRSMHFLILPKKVSRYLDRKIISLEDILTLISPNLSYEEEEETA